MNIIKQAVSWTENINVYSHRCENMKSNIDGKRLTILYIANVIYVQSCLVPRKSFNA
jgi:hypothetical protein